MAVRGVQTMTDYSREEGEKRVKSFLCDKCLAMVEVQGMKIPVRELCDPCADRILRWALHLEGFE